MSLDWSLAIFFLLVIATAMSGAVFRPGKWYSVLRKPSWTPPNWLFGPVWSVLYVMIAIAGWLVWRSGASDSPAMIFWGLQLVFNAAWSGLFFGLRRMDLAFVDALLMWLSVAAFIVTAAGVSTAAALLFAPYLLWVTIAATLNWSVWRLNAAQA